VQQHTGILQLLGTLAATELLSEDGQGGRYGLVRDRHTGYPNLARLACEVCSSADDLGAEVIVCTYVIRYRLGE
jgi:hypothetical protein